VCQACKAGHCHTTAVYPAPEHRQSSARAAQKRGACASLQGKKEEKYRKKLKTYFSSKKTFYQLNGFCAKCSLNLQPQQPELVPHEPCHS
jgi:hypothetical protein